VTTQDSERSTIIENGEADEAIGVDVLVDWDVADEDDFGGLYGLLC
jgi:hypothetical protein